MQLKKDGGDSLQPRRILFLFCLDTCSCNVFYLQSKKYFTAFLSLIFALLFIGCANNEKPLFETVLASETGITFKNTIINSDTLTVLDFEYLYNGGGVGIGDINNDGLQDIYFTGNMTSGKLFLNKGNWKFEDITEKAGVSTSVWVNGVSMVDINQDGYKDIFLCVAGILLQQKRKTCFSSTMVTKHLLNQQPAMAYRVPITIFNLRFSTMTETVTSMFIS